MVQAHLSIKKNRLKLYEEDKHYLSNGSNFEIELTNNKDIKYKVEIFLNDKSIGEVVIGKGHFYLERHIETMSKFVFNTFEVDDCKDTLAARNRNGKVKVVFYPEEIPKKFSSISWKTSNPYYGNYTSNTSYANTTTLLSCTTDVVNTTYTGRISEGETSSQSFGTDRGTKFAQYASDTYEYQILPIELKPYEGVKLYCYECGVKLVNNKWNYCPTCGTKIC